MAMDWKELDFFGESKQIPKKNFGIVSSNVLFSDFTPYDGTYYGYANLVRKINVSNLPNYKHCTKEDFVCTFKFKINISENQERPSVNIYVSDYNANTGDITLEAQCLYSSDPGENVELTLMFSELMIYSFYDVSVKDFN